MNAELGLSMGNIFFFLFSRMQREYIGHFVGRSVRPSVRNKVVFNAFYRVFDGSEWQRRNLME